MSALPPPKVPKSLFGRIVKGTGAFILAGWVLLEEWFWDVVNRISAVLGQLPLFKQAEALIARAPPMVALLLFLIPGLLLFPFKLAGLYLIGHGQKTLGIAVFIVAKLVGTALLARIFNLTKPALMTIGWFARCYNWLSSWKARLMNYVRQTTPYQRAKALKAQVREQVRKWWAARAH